MIIQGNALHLPIKDNSVQCCVTSPPYWGLRDYGLESTSWPDVSYSPMPGLPNIDVFLWEGCLGLEPSPDMFVGHIVLVFREIRRVLRKDGTLWLNFGDSYATGAGRVGNCPGGGDQGKRWRDPTLKRYLGNHADDPKRTAHSSSMIGPMIQPNRMPIKGLKPKDLIGIPWRVVFALQADGWWLRQDIIWNKPNPMPESVADRCTKSHEYLFLLSKSAKYFYDADAVKEPAKEWHGQAATFDRGANAVASHIIPGQSAAQHRRRPSEEKESFNGKTEIMADTGQNAFRCVTEYRNKRSVWTIATKPCKAAHFAIMPEALVESCVMAGSKPGDIILDPFGGSMTVGKVAEKHGRQFVGVELNWDYIDIGKKRMSFNQMRLSV